MYTITSMYHTIPLPCNRGHIFMELAESWSNSHRKIYIADTFIGDSCYSGHYFLVPSEHSLRHLTPTKA